jgi:hypothetical protein
MSPARLCEDCALGHIVTPAAIRMDWDLGSKWLCEACAREYASRWTGARA